MAVAERHPAGPLGRGAHGPRRAAGAARARAARLGAALPALLGAALAPACSREPPRGSAVLITLDTTRADALSCYGGRPGVTPNLDRLAAEGVLYERASTVAPLTLPSHASMLTGLYPPRHGVRDNGAYVLPRSAETLAELAQREGCQTGAFVAAVVLDASFGLDQGFDVYDAPARPEGSSTSRYDERPAPAVVDAALAWIEARDRKRPYFLWVHLFDPHGPYEPPDDLRSGPLAGAPYLGEVALADREVGRLLEGLRRADALDGAVVAVAADHGEAFGEHGEHTHGAFCWQTTIEVPLIVRDGVRRGLRSRELVSVVDLYPTLLEAHGIAAPEGIDGRSLLGEADRAGRGVYFEAYTGFLAYGWSHLAGWRDERGKSLHSSQPLFFDVETDPREEHDLSAERRNDLARHLVALEAIARSPALTPDDAAAPRPDLARLGYTGSAEPPPRLPHPAAPSDRPAPHARAKSLARTLKAQELANRGQTEQAIAILAPLAAEEPDNHFALDRLATALIQAGRHAEALPLLERVVRHGPQWAGTWFNYATCLTQAARPQDALHALERAVTLDPTTPLFRQALAEAQRNPARSNEAQRNPAPQPEAQNPDTQPNAPPPPR